MEQLEFQIRILNQCRGRAPLIGLQTVTPLDRLFFLLNLKYHLDRVNSIGFNLFAAKGVGAVADISTNEREKMAFSAVVVLAL